MHVFLGCCTVIVFGPAACLADTIATEKTAAIAPSEVDDNHREG